ncbi:membrane-bound serine protease (ClpP class) [Natronospira proteinivora]|uniref:Membrane-bound serine protease (ClpP class) n=1 Tax=Natronospira proteinivora TaxID=1807133 RepID=A0ABT1G920_9GAMM|nr:nodulation protein NfeD [Natronospira proteinivora]MCP1726803.1 membrane-bound serine protease (ClpP class) [Natronospira proteinivora]
MTSIRFITALVCILLGILLISGPALLAQDDSSNVQAQSEGGQGVILRVDGAIGPATLDYLRRSISNAGDDNQHLIIIEMDTPGGLVDTTREINKAILSSRVPVVVYVSPSGSRAASAGTFIMYASHVAAMAPATSLGAATPVQIGGAPMDPEDAEEENGEEDAPEPQGDAERKAINDAVSYIRSLAEQRGRNADWAERAVREAATLNSREALEENVIDIVATDLDDLLSQVHGMEVDTEVGTIRLNTENLSLERQDPDWRTELLSVLTNPTVAYLLMLIGIYGLIFEGYNPGAIVPGVVGAICLLLALFAFQVLPVNYAGFALIALGLALIISEAFVPSFGILGIGGLISFVIGSIILMDTDVPGFGIPLPLIATVSIIGGLLTFSIIGFALRARQSPVVSGHEEMIGLIATAREDFTESGQIWVRSEIWRGRSSRPVSKGDKLRVVDIDGLVLQVEPLDNEDQN